MVKQSHGLIVSGDDARQDGLRDQGNEPLADDEGRRVRGRGCSGAERRDG